MTRGTRALVPVGLISIGTASGWVAFIGLLLLMGA